MNAGRLRALACASVAALSGAAWADEWVELSPETSPSPRGQCEAVYDTARARIVLFGGATGAHNASGTLLGDTWEWDGATWIEKDPDHSPAPRTWHAMAYDEVRECVVLFGGYSSTSGENNETWEWDGTDWTLRTPSAAPSRRRGAAIAWDPVNERILLFGGYSDSVGGTGCLGDTWSWDGTTWTQLSPSASPSSREDHHMATLPDGSGVLLHGGALGRGSGGSDWVAGGAETWEWDGTTWTNVTPSTSPPARYGHNLAQADAGGRLLTFGGSYELDTRLNHGDTWIWDDGAWEDVSGPGPVRRSACALAYDPVRGELILFGGSASPAAGVTYLYDDTWVYSTNAAPTADAGDDLTVECASEDGTEVSLDGTGSSDPDEDDLEYFWSVPAGSGASIDDPTSATPTGTFPAGPTLVTLTVTDGHGGVSHDDVLVTVVDTEPPVLVCTTDVIALWPPNHRMVPVTIFVEVSDACSDPSEVSVICAVTSDEPDDTKGDGSFTGDVDGEDGYSAPVEVELVYDDDLGVFVGVVELRAERSGSGSGRTYSILCEVTDDAGNSGVGSCVVVVPHDRRRSNR